MCPEKDLLTSEWFITPIRFQESGLTNVLHGDASLGGPTVEIGGMNWLPLDWEGDKQQGANRSRDAACATPDQHAPIVQTLLDGLKELKRERSG
ncbi:hypothetical protein E4U53_003723 [Claviceps sorghi]|nr:hypothetical protein E4U53_003723 [Claviceps sorghi]